MTAARELLGDYLECRRLLEIEAAGAGRRARDEADLVALSEALERMTAAAVRAPPADPAAEDRFHEADIAFHRARHRRPPATARSAA